MTWSILPFACSALHACLRAAVNPAQEQFACFAVSSEVGMAETECETINEGGNYAARDMLSRSAEYLTNQNSRFMHTAAFCPAVLQIC